MSRNPDGFSFDFTDSTVMSFALAASGGVIALARAPASDWLQGVHGLEPCLGKLAVSGTQYYWVSYPAREGSSARGSKVSRLVAERDLGLGSERPSTSLPTITGSRLRHDHIEILPADLRGHLRRQRRPG